MNFNYFLKLLEQYQLGVVFISLLLYVLFFNRRNTFTVTVFLYFTISIIHQMSEPVLMKSGALAWYMFFAFTDFLYVFFVYFLHSKLKLSIDRFSQFIISGMLLLGFVQVARYVDRIELKTNVLGYLYQHLIPAVNLTNTAFISFFTIGSILVFLKSKFIGNWEIK